MGYIEELRKIVGHRPLIFVGSVVVVVDEQGRTIAATAEISGRCMGNSRWVNGIRGIHGRCGEA